MSNNSTVFTELSDMVTTNYYITSAHTEVTGVDAILLAAIGKIVYNQISRYFISNTLNVIKNDLHVMYLS